MSQTCGMRGSEVRGERAGEALFRRAEADDTASIREAEELAAPLGVTLRGSGEASSAFESLTTMTPTRRIRRVAGPGL